MPYGTPEHHEDQAKFVAYFNVSNSNVNITGSLEFQAIGDAATGTPPTDVDDLFQHVVDHLASLPEFPGSGAGATIQVGAVKSYLSGEQVTPTP